MQLETGDKHIQKAHLSPKPPRLEAGPATPNQIIAGVDMANWTAATWQPGLSPGLSDLNR